MHQSEHEIRANAQRAAYYASFDRAVATLSEADRPRIDLHSSSVDSDGLWKLRDVVGIEVKSVRDPSLPPIEAPAPKAIAAPKSPPVRSGLSEDDVAAVLLKLIKHTKEIDQAVAEAVPALVKRIKALESRDVVDNELVTEMGKALERIDEIEARGFKYVGRYQGAASYKKCDVVSVAFLVERHLNWQKRRASAVVWANVNWDACAT